MIIKKRLVTLIVTGSICAFLACYILCTPCVVLTSLWHDIFTSILTGCIFSFPGVLAAIVTDSKHNKREFRTLLLTLKNLLDRLRSASIDEKAIILSSLTSYYYQALYFSQDNNLHFPVIKIKSKGNVNYKRSFDGLITSVFVLSQNFSSRDSDECRQEYTGKIDECLHTIELLLGTHSSNTR